MTTFDEVSVEVSYAIENFVYGLEGYLVISQPFLPYIWGISDHRIKSPIIPTFRLIEEHFGKLQFPVEEAFCPGKGQGCLNGLLIFLVHFAIVIVDNRPCTILCDAFRALIAEVLADPDIQQAFERGEGIVGPFVGLARFGNFLGSDV